MSTNVANVDICQRKLAWAIKQCLSAYITLMLEKCKDRFVEHLQIIQLCEADLNFVFHVIWVHRLTRQANKYSALNHASLHVQPTPPYIFPSYDRCWMLYIHFSQQQRYIPNQTGSIAR